MGVKAYEKMSCTELEIWPLTLRINQRGGNYLFVIRSTIYVWPQSCAEVM